MSIVVFEPLFNFYFQTKIANFLKKLYIEKRFQSCLIYYTTRHACSVSNMLRVNNISHNNIWYYRVKF